MLAASRFEGEVWGGFVLCYQSDATLVSGVLLLSVGCLLDLYLKVAFGHLISNTPLISFCVVNRMLLLSVGCSFCLLGACLVSI